MCGAGRRLTGRLAADAVTSVPQSGKIERSGNGYLWLSLRPSSEPLSIEAVLRRMSLAGCRHSFRAGGRRFKQKSHYQRGRP
jgi:hypothetical protein